MSVLVYAKHEPWDHRIGPIVHEMRRLGPPKLRSLFDGEAFFLLEGSHRIAAADYLGYIPILKVEPFDYKTDHLAMFWLRVKRRLPVYEFPYVKTVDMPVHWFLKDVG